LLRILEFRMFVCKAGMFRRQVEMFLLQHRISRFNRLYFPSNKRNLAANRGLSGAIDNHLVKRVDVFCKSHGNAQ